MHDTAELRLLGVHFTGESDLRVHDTAELRLLGVHFTGESDLRVQYAAESEINLNPLALRKFLFFYFNVSS